MNDKESTLLELRKEIKIIFENLKIIENMNCKSTIYIDNKKLNLYPITIDRLKNLLQIEEERIEIILRRNFKELNNDKEKKENRSIR